MKVAIIGGGLAGIVCATQLERLGIPAVIFESNKDIAEPYRHVGAAIQIVLRPIKDPLKYLNDTYAISLIPSGDVKKVIHKSPCVSTTITGNLGYLLHRGNQPDSIDKQLGGNLKSEIYLNTKADYKNLKDKFDYVIVASGNFQEAKEMGIWKQTIKMSVKGTVISGDFKIDTFMVWLNKNYCKSGYAYLAPFSNKEATLALAVNDIQIDEIDKYWDLFIKSENIDCRIIESFKRDHFSGFVYPHKVDNIYFIGNAGGCLDPLLGFGVFPTIVTASEAVKSIVSGNDFEYGIRKVVDLNRKLLEFRKAFNRLDNKGYDRLVWMLGLPGVNLCVYRSNLNAVSLGYAGLKVLNAILKDQNNKSPAL